MLRVLQNHKNEKRKSGVMVLMSAKDSLLSSFILLGLQAFQKKNEEKEAKEVL